MYRKMIYPVVSIQTNQLSVILKLLYGNLETEGGNQVYKYQSIAHQILHLIEEGEYEEQIPPVRKLMEVFGASQSTVTHALQHLVTMNQVYAKANVGYFVLSNNHKEATVENSYDFSTASTSWTDFPWENYSQGLEIAIQNKKTELFTYGAITGNEELKDLFRKLLEEDQIYTKNERIIITSGSQQALHILSLIIMTRKKSILIEQPTYSQMVHLIERLQLNHVIYSRDWNKIQIKELEKVIQEERPDFVYLMPRLHNPLGTTMTEQEKKSVLALSEKYDFYIIEDDYLGDFEGGNRYQTLFELDVHQRVIYLKSFSKIMFPGQRLGLAVLPESLLDDFQSFKEISDIHTNSLSQIIMQTFIESGLYAHHKHKIVLKHQQKADALQKGLKKYFSAYSFNDNNQMHTVIKLPKQTNMNKLHQELVRRRVWVDNYKGNYLTGYTQNQKFLKLNTTSLPVDKIDEGLQEIRKAIKASKTL